MIKFYCPNCRIKLGVPDEYAGRRVRCNKCGQSCVVPKTTDEVSAAGISPQLTGAPVPAPASPSVRKTQPAQSELQRISQSLESDQLELVDDSRMELREDTNAQLLQQIRRDQMAKEKIRPPSGKSVKGSSARTNQKARSRFLFSLSDVVPEALQFPLSLIVGILAACLMIVIWIAVSRSTGNPLGIFIALVPLAGAYAMRFTSVYRTFTSGALAVIFGIAGIVAGRIIIAQSAIIPWLQKTASQEILVDVKTLLADPKVQFSPDETIKPIARDNVWMTCAAIVAAVEQDSAEPVAARKIVLHILKVTNRTDLLESFSQAGGGYHEPPLPELNEQERQVMEKAFGHLVEWKNESDRLVAARKYYPALAHLAGQCRIQRTLEDPQETFRFALLMTLTMLDAVWLVVGLCGAYFLAST